MLAEEILRAEMKRRYGKGTYFYQMDITAEPERLLTPNEIEITDEENR